MDKKYVDLLIKYEDYGLDDREFLELFSYLIKTGDCWTLQGHYGRTANELIEGQYIDEQGNILDIE